MPPECPEWNAQVSTRQFFDRDWSHVLPSIKGLGIEPIHVACELDIEEQTEEFIKQVECK